MTAPDWALGYDLALLKSIAAVFAASFKPHTYGAFGVPNERDVASALQSKQLAWIRSDDRESIAAVAIYKVAKSTSKQSDFAQRTIHIRPGDLQIKALAGSTNGCITLLEKLFAKVGTRPAWLEIYAENPDLCSIPEQLGFSLAATKISASSDIKALYLRGVHPETRVEGKLASADFPALRLIKPYLTKEQVSTCLAEIAAYKPTWEQHYSSYNKRKSWTAIALQGYDPKDPHFIIKPAEMSKGWKQENPERLSATCAPTHAASMLPTIWSIANSIPGTPERVRLMKLRASNGELTRHADITDRNAGTANGKIARLHIPLQTASGCMFSGWELSGKKVQHHFPAGALFYLDIRKPHAVKNTSEIDRIHLVVDVACNATTREWISG
jgi:hypothetical protein